MQNSIEFTYLCQPPNRYTFKQPKVKAWVEGHCRGRVLNLFAGVVELDVDETRNDIDPEMPADYHMAAQEFVDTWGGEPFDTVILDPPYNVRQSRQRYNGNYIGSFTKIKDSLLRIISPTGRVISLGYDTTGMSARRGFEKQAICLVCHKGSHNDTIILVEDKTNGR